MVLASTSQPVHSVVPPLAVPLEETRLDLYLVPNDPEQTTLVSATGEGIYQVITSQARTFGGPAVTVLKRRAHSVGDSIVAEVEWRRWGAHPVVRSSIFDGVHQKLKLCELLYKKGGRFSWYVFRVYSCSCSRELKGFVCRTRYFLGNDDITYRWKLVKGVGYVVRTICCVMLGSRTDTMQLTNRSSGEEIARYTRDVVSEGFFRGERKWLLQMEPGTLSVDIIVLTFIIMEKKRRDRVADHMAIIKDDSDDPDDGIGAEIGLEI